MKKLQIYFLKTSKYVPWFICLVALVFPVFGKIETVKAASISFPATTSVPLTQTDWIDQSVAFPKFDPSLGTLTKVQILFNGSFISTISLNNPFEEPISVDAHIHAEFAIQDVEEKLPLTSFDIDTNYVHADMPAHSGIILPDISDEWIGPSDVFEYFTSDLLEEFTGLSTIDFNAACSTSVVTNAPQNDSIPHASLGGTINYYYNVVPEPTMLTLLASLGLAACVFRFFSTRANNKKDFS